MGLFGGGSGADWLIAGLGNPEPKYDGTRHNTGFAALDALAEAWGCEINKSKWQGLYGIAQVDGRKVMLLKPLTYMNLSGQSIAPAAAFYKIPRNHIIVLCDDIAQEPGHIRIRPSGSAGGLPPAARIFTASALALAPSRARIMIWLTGCWASSRPMTPSL